MIDLKNFKVGDILKNGTAISIRAVRPDDKSRFAEAFRHLGPDAVYTRFFCCKKELTDEDLKIAVEVDFENTVALVVTIPAGGGDETIIGAGRYILCGQPHELRSAEIAFTVGENYQCQGIASRILRHLIHIAQQKGVSQFEAEVLPKNRAMLAVFARSGLPMKESQEEGTVHVYLSLSAQAPWTAEP